LAAISPRRGGPQKFGIPFAGLYGEWFMAASVIRDLAALNKVETPPWDVWGAMPRAGATLDGSQRDYFDQLAALAFDPDASTL